MKKILFALAVLPILAFVSCSSDDDDTPNIPEDNFAHNIELLYGQWRATGVELGELTIDLTETDDEGNLNFDPTYITFGEDGSFSSEGLIGEAKGKYTTQDKTIIADIGEEKMSFKMTDLDKETAEIVIDASAFDLDIIPENLGDVTVILTKQEKEEEEGEEVEEEEEEEETEGEE